MLKIGAQDITGLYVGETKIKRAYVGTDLIYSEGADKEYQDYEYFAVDTSAVVGNYVPYVSITINPRLSVNGKNTAHTFYFKASVPTNTLSSGTAYSHFVYTAATSMSGGKYGQYILRVSVNTSQRLYMYTAASTGTSTNLGYGYTGYISGTGFLDTPVIYKYIFNSAGLEYDMYAGDTLVRAGATSGYTYPFSNLLTSSKMNIAIMGRHSAKATSATSVDIFRSKLHAFSIFSPAVTFDESMWYIPCKKLATGELGFHRKSDDSFLLMNNSQYIITGPKIN